MKRQLNREMKKLLLLAFLLLGSSEVSAQVSMALTDTTQMRRVIVALREYDPHEGEWSWYSDPERRANDVAWGHLADALELSLDFKIGHVLNAQGASMIQIALKRKQERDAYYASDEYKNLKYAEAHPVYTLKNGTVFNPDSAKAHLAWISSGDGDETETFDIGKKQISFQRIKPGVFKQR